MHRSFGKKKKMLSILLLLLAAFLVQPVNLGRAAGVTPGFAIGDNPFRFVGGFLPGWHWGLEYWSEAADHDLIASARASGMTVIHIMLPQFETSLGSYDETKLQKLDHFLDAAYYANVYVMPSFIQAYGEVTLDPSNPYYHEHGIEGIIKDPTLRGGLTLRQHFKNRIAALVNRTNTVNLRKYKDDPTIMAWIVCDEPISAPFNYPNGMPQITLEELTDWFQETASYIKSLDSNHLVTVWSQPAIQEFFGWTLGYLQALGIPEFDFMYTEDAGLRIVAGLVQGYNCTGQTPQYMLDQFLPGKPVAFHPAFTSDCWDQNIICDGDFTVQSTNLNLAIPEYFKIGGNAVVIQNWGTDLYSSVPSWAQCLTYTDSYPKIVTMAQTHSAMINPGAHPVAPLQFVSVIYGLNVAKSGSGSGTVTSNPAGISCGSDCSYAFTQTSVVTLTAQADADSIFTGWSDAGCSGTGTCQITVGADVTVTATFIPVSYLQPKSPANGTTFDTCSYFSPPVFEWTSSQSFQGLELQFYPSIDPVKPIIVKVKDPTVTQLQMQANTWKKILKLPGLSGGEIKWKIVGTNKGQPPVESDVFTMTIAEPQAVETPVITPVSKTGLPTLGWENACATKFKVFFGPDPTFSRKKKLSFTYQNPTDNGETFIAPLTEGTWNAIRKLVDDQAGTTIYWYVESWDIIKRYLRTNTMQFILQP
jgi:hypothetical protein